VNHGQSVRESRHPQAIAMTACGCLFLFFAIAFPVFMWYFVLLQEVKSVKDRMEVLFFGFRMAQRFCQKLNVYGGGRSALTNQVKRNAL